MLNYAICEISGKQYKVIPGQIIEVDFLGDGQSKDIEAKIMLLSEDGNLKIGNPYLKESLNLKKIEDIKGVKIRVSKYHPKANYRKTTGYRSKRTRVVLDVKKVA